MKQNFTNSPKEENAKIIRTIKEFAQSEYIEKKSRFIAQAFPISSISEAENLLSSIRNKYSDSTHNCYAYVVGVQKDVFKFSDDGEPAGTAGKPIYQTIINFDLTNVLVVVTRYFGGIKLGASGLVRAYAKAAKMVLDVAPKVEIPITVQVSLEMKYSDYPKVKNIIFNNFVEVKESFTDNVQIIGEIPVAFKNEVIERIRNILSGNVKIK